MAETTFRILLSFLILFYISFSPLLNATALKYPVVFNFGDSNSDTGGAIAAQGKRRKPPFGQTYFGKPNGRNSDGRLIIDFLMHSMELPFLNPYLDSVGPPSFKQGCNFAYGGGWIGKTPPNLQYHIGSFRAQVAEFLRFKAQVLELQSESSSGKVDEFLPDKGSFEKGLYIFDIGQNDVFGALKSNSSSYVSETIPVTLSEFESGLKKLYAEGARNFQIHNTGPVGCLPSYIAKFGTNPTKLDKWGCLESYNEAANLFNKQLHQVCKRLQAQYSDAVFKYVDVFKIKHNLFVNPSQCGFEQPLMVCCGYGGPPYNNRIGCGATQVIDGRNVTGNACKWIKRAVSWDGIHYTDAASNYVAMQILTGNYTDPPDDPDN